MEQLGRGRETSSGGCSVIGESVASRDSCSEGVGTGQFVSSNLAQGRMAVNGTQVGGSSSLPLLSPCTVVQVAACSVAS